MYNCVVCSKEFTKRKYLYEHLTVVHNYEEGDTSTSNKKYEICEICKMVFSDLKEHKKNTHGVIISDEKSSQSLCSFCGVFFSNATIMKQHQERMHSQENRSDVAVVDKIYKPRIHCPECKIENLKTHKNLRHHLLMNHNVEIKYEEFNFESFEEFKKWKENYEDTYFVLYSKDCSPRPRNNNRHVVYYNCHRSYSYRSKAKQSKINFMRSNKIGFVCPSHMKVVTTNNSCTVHFWKTHLGHFAELHRCRLRKASRARIANKMEEGVPLQTILDETRNSLVKNKVVNRTHLLTRRDLYNISKEYNIKFARDSEDIADLEEWVKEMQQQPESPVIYFKNVGESDEMFLSKSDFVLMLIVPTQIPQLQKFGKNIICLDRIQYDSSCELTLNIIMTVDSELQVACAVAFCFSNRSDEMILKFFFQQIKKYVGQISTSIFISDQNPATYKSWGNIMSEVPCCFWSKWHIAQDWAIHAEILISNQNKLKQINEILKSLQETDKQDFFNGMLGNMLGIFSKDLDLSDFGNYFVKNYASSANMWAGCHRQDISNLDVYLQSLHAVYDKVCSQISKRKTFLKVVETVLKIARDNYFQHIVEIASDSQNTQTSCDGLFANILTMDHESIHSTFENSHQERKLTNTQDEQCITSSPEDTNEMSSAETCDNLSIKGSEQSDAEILNNCNSDIFEVTYLEDNQNKTNSTFLNEFQHKANLILNLSEHINVSKEDQTVVLKCFDEIIKILNSSVTQE